MTLAAASITSARDTGRGVFVLSAGLEPGVTGEAIQNPLRRRCLLAAIQGHFRWNARASPATHPLRTISNRCANCIAVQMVDFAGLEAEGQREVGASGAALPRRGASRPRLTKGPHVALQRVAIPSLPQGSSLRYCITSNGRHCANIKPARHSEPLLLVP
jgi:hypothetical protein